MIGIAAAILLIGVGRIAGVSGLTARVVHLAINDTPWPIAAAFVIGLPIGAAVIAAVLGPIQTHYTGRLSVLIGSGLLVGIGTRLSGGCTSGHGVCGISRFSPRSLVATAVFITAGAITVAAINAWGL
jgi:uncharacterized protein